MNKHQICYLCAKEIARDDLSLDHIPPKQFYPSYLREKFNLSKIETFPTHVNCNKNYQNDEDYFIHTLGPLTMNSSKAGEALWEDIKKSLKREEGKVLAQKISNEFSEKSDAGIILPGDLALKKFDGDRVWRVVWKIIRGLFYKEYHRILPENMKRVFDLLQPEFNHLPEIFQYVRDTHSRGNYAGIFDYKYIKPKGDNNIHYWALLFWDKIIMTAIFHDPDCVCGKCKIF